MCKRSALAWLLGLASLASAHAATLTPYPTAAELEEKLVHAAPADRPGLLVQLSTEIEPDNTDRAWDYAQQARREAHTPVDAIRADARIAALERRRGHYPEALALATGALKHATTLHHDALRTELLLTMALTQDSLSDFAAALDLFRELIPLAEAGGDPFFLGRAYNILGIVYSDSGKLDLARTAYEKGASYAEKCPDRRLLAAIQMNLGNITMAAGQYPQARRYYEESLAVRQEIGTDARGLADSHQNLGELAIAEGHPADALPHLDEAIARHTRLGLKRNLTNAQVTYATALRLLGRNDEALPYLQAALTQAEALGSQTILARVHLAFANYHEERGDFRAALESERKYAAATDAVLGEKSRQRFDSLQARFDAERREHEIDVLHRDQAVKEAELARARGQRYGLLALLGLGVITLAAVISRHRVKERAEQRILAETRAGRDAAEEAAALKTRLLAMVSHDIRSPLGNILFLAGDLQVHPPSVPPGPGDERLRLIEQQTEQVLLLAQDLLDAAALEAGRLELKIALLDLAQIASTVLERLRPLAEAKGQVLAFAPPAPQAGAFSGDASRLDQVFSNLLSNAIKYSPPYTTVRITLARRDGVVRLSVQDEGPGVAAEDVPNLFRPFARLRARPTAGESSHGLGLSIAYDLVQLHGGRLLVESVAGRGATFVVELPVPAQPVS